MMHHEANGVTEPLLPVHGRNGHSRSAPSSPNHQYDGDRLDGKDRSLREVVSPERTREKYLKQLGYTPLIFKASWAAFTGTA